MNKPMLAIASALLFSACYSGGLDYPGYDNGMSSGATARLHGTVFDTEFDDQADLWMNSYDGWMDLSATTQLDNNGTSGMMFVMGELDAKEIFTPGNHQVNPFTVEVLLCGEAGGEYYDEPAEDIEIDVTEQDGGLLLARFRGELGPRFQEVEFLLDAETLAPVGDGDL